MEDVRQDYVEASDAALVVAIGRYQQAALAESVADADVVITTAQVPGRPAPLLVSREMVESMRPGSVIVDVAVDQGGCIATTRETTHDNPVFELHGVVHYAVGNMPGAVPHTSTYALTNATLPFQLQVALYGALGAGRREPAMAHGVNTVNGRHTNDIVAAALGADAVSPFDA